MIGIVRCLIVAPSARAEVSIAEAAIIAESRLFAHQTPEERTVERRREDAVNDAKLAQEYRQSAARWRREAARRRLPGFDRRTARAWRSRLAWETQRRESLLRQAERDESIADSLERGSRADQAQHVANPAWSGIKLQPDEFTARLTLQLDRVSPTLKPEERRAQVEVFRGRVLAQALARSERAQLLAVIESAHLDPSPLLEVANATPREADALDGLLLKLAALLERVQLRLDARAAQAAKKAAPRTRRGAKLNSDPANDEALFIDWKGSGQSKQAFARLRGLDPRVVETAIKRHHTRTRESQSKRVPKNPGQATRSTVGRKAAEPKPLAD